MTLEGWSASFPPKLKGYFLGVQFHGEKDILISSQSGFTVSTCGIVVPIFAGRPPPNEEEA